MAARALSVNALPAKAMDALLAPVREYGQTVLAACEDPHAELLALVWGPRFDRLHAQGLLARHNAMEPIPLHAVHQSVVQSVAQAAELFDHLPGTQQAWVRRLILRHRAGGTMQHAPHLAD